MVGWGTKYEEAVNRTAMYDICFRVGVMSQGAGTLPMFPEACKLVEGLYSPALGSISPHPSASAGGFQSTDFLVVGDSSLAMCWMQGRRCIRKTTIGPTLQAAGHHNVQPGDWGDRLSDGVGKGSRHSTLSWILSIPRSISLRLAASSSSSTGPGMMSMVTTVTWATRGTSRPSG